MSTVSVRLSKDEEELFNEYAKMKNMPFSVLFKHSLEMKIEEEFDLQCIREYEETSVINGNPTLIHEEVNKSLGS